MAKWGIRGGYTGGKAGHNSGDLILPLPLHEGGDVMPLLPNLPSCMWGGDVMLPPPLACCTVRGHCRQVFGDMVNTF